MEAFEFTRKIQRNDSLQFMEVEADSITLLKQGDIKSFELFYRMFCDRVYAFALSILKDDADAKEVVQETFFRLWLHRDKLDSDLSIQAYVFAIAKNQAITIIRKRHNQFSNDSQLEELTDETQEQIVFNDLKKQIIEIIGLLPDRRKEIFLLSRRDGLQPKEIALRLGLSVQTVHNQISSALTFIREHLNEDLMMIVFIILFPGSKF